MIFRHAAAVVLLAGAAAACGWIWGDRLPPGSLRGATLGVAVAALGSVAGMALTAWSFDKSQRVFLSTLAIGLLGRLFGYGGVLIYVALVTSIDPNASAVALMGSYVVFQVIEVRFALRGLKRGKG